MRNAAFRHALSACAVVLALAASSLPSAAAAQELKIAVAADITSMDPHFFNLFPNNNVAEHIFDKLVQMDADSKMIPGLATSWKVIDPTTWEFKLRKGVKFHRRQRSSPPRTSRSRSTACRTCPNSPGPFSALHQGDRREGDRRSRTRSASSTRRRIPSSPNDLSTIYIVSKKVATGATTEDFNSGKAAIGSGRYKLVKYMSGDRVDLVRNDNYWGEKSPWDKVTFKIIKNEPARVAALLSGDVDAIEQPPTADLARIKGDPKFTVTSKISHRVIYFNFDHLERSSPFITDKAGKPLAKNPLLDVRVRRAISKAINRQAIVDRVMEGQGVPSGQLVSEKLFGNVPGLKADALRRRRREEADGRSRLSGRFQHHDPRSRRAATSTTRRSCRRSRRCSRGSASRRRSRPRRWGRTPARASKQEFSFHMVGWGASTGEASSPLRSLLATFNRDKGLGAVNWGRYSNVKVDYLIEQALQQVDDENRRVMLQNATKLAMEDLGIMPIHFQFTIWATKKNVAYTPRTDEYTLAFQFQPVGRRSRDRLRFEGVRARADGARAVPRHR